MNDDYCYLIYGIRERGFKAGIYQTREEALEARKQFPRAYGYVVIPFTKYQGRRIVWTLLGADLIDHC